VRACLRWRANAEDFLHRSLRSAPAPLSHGEVSADPYEDDRLGRLAVSKDGLRQRDRLVLDTLAQWDISTAVTIAGGYARHIEDTVDIHFATVENAATGRR
jgi:acetoin utilization deacetylase AcuC-like enzyme